MAKTPTNKIKKKLTKRINSIEFSLFHHNCSNYESIPNGYAVVHFVVLEVFLNPQITAPKKKYEEP